MRHPLALALTVASVAVTVAVYAVDPGLREPGRAPGTGTLLAVLTAFGAACAGLALLVT